MEKILTFKNIQLEPLAKFLEGLSLNGLSSRGRTKLKKMIVAKGQEYNEEIEDERDPYFVKDDSGNRIIENNAYVFKDNNDKAKLENTILGIQYEDTVIDCVEYEEKFRALYEALKIYSADFSGEDADLYDLLMDQLENVYGKEDEDDDNTNE